MSSSSSRLYPPLVNTFILNVIAISLVAFFALQHPFVKPFVQDPFLIPTYVIETSTSLIHTLRVLSSSSSNYAKERSSILTSSFNYYLGNDLGKYGRQDFHEWSIWKNSLILPKKIHEGVPHVVAIWLRNYVAINVVYFGIAGGWALVLYYFAVDIFFPKDQKSGKRTIPQKESLYAQVFVSIKAMPLYVMVPTLCEWVAERGLTRSTNSFEEMGGIEGWLVWTCVYLLFVEWSIYWIHRKLHEVRWLYKWLHEDHHIYNNQHDMSPLAGLAFHPLDGALQASPYFVGLFLMPVHFWTHTAFLFFTGVWTASIHDTLPPSTEPIMGSKYHMYHHTAYRDNYGQFFVFFDWLHGTLTDPLERDGKEKFGKAVFIKDPVAAAVNETKTRQEKSTQ